MEVSTAKKIMGDNFIGMDELCSLSDVFDLETEFRIPSINFDENFLLEKNKTHLLLLCVSSFKNRNPVTIRNIRNIIIERKEAPFFYNQDWFLNESFIDEELTCQWILVSKSILRESRGCEPKEIKKKYPLYKAIELTYAFFVNYFVSGGEKLWNNDYVWCSDFDDKGDQIYVGRYTDASGLNADGFEIHRHLKIKMNYGVV